MSNGCHSLQCINASAAVHSAEGCTRARLPAPFWASVDALVAPLPPCRCAAGLGLTALVLLALRLGSTEAFQSAAAFDWTAGDVSFGLGDALGGLLWAASLYFCSPLQVSS